MSDTQSVSVSVTDLGRAEAVDRLKQYTLKNTELFSFKGLSCWARLVGAHDGDTATVIMEAVPGRFSRVILRIHGIDTCEMTSVDPRLKATAVRARNRAISFLTGLQLDDHKQYKRTDIERLLEQQTYAVWVECDDNDKYGRTLAQLKPDPTSAATVSSVLLEERLAMPYGGGTKKTEEQQAQALGL